VPVGILPGSQYSAGQVQLKGDDFLVIYTDGITEAVGDKDELFGEQRLEKLLRESRARTAEELRDSILQKVAEFSGSQPQADDETLLVARIQ